MKGVAIQQATCSARTVFAATLISPPLCILYNNSAHRRFICITQSTAALSLNFNTTMEQRGHKVVHKIPPHPEKKIACETIGLFCSCTFDDIVAAVKWTVKLFSEYLIFIAEHLFHDFIMYH
jgi:hypothetical protein